MKIQKGILVIFFAAMFLPLTSVGGFAQVTLGDYTLNGEVDLGGRFFINEPNHVNRGYFEQYIPYPTGVLLDQLYAQLENKDGSEYYKFFMSRPGERDEDFLLQAGKIGCYKLEIEYDQLQHLYSTVNPNFQDMSILVQRLRISGDYTPTPDIDVYADYNLLKRNGEMPSSAIVQGPPNAYAFTSSLKPIDFTQNDLRIGADYAQPTYQFQLGYHFSQFDDGNKEFLANPASATGWQSLPPSNTANYINGAGALNLPQCANTRLTGNFTYGWLNQNDPVFQSNGSSLYPSSFPPGVMNTPMGDSDLSASTFAGDLLGVSRPTDQLSVRYSYRAYDFQNDNLNNPVLLNAFFGSNGVNVPLLKMEQYSYLRQTVNLGADYKITPYAAVDLGYTYGSVDRDFNEGSTSTNTPKVQFKFYPCDWVNLIAGYAYSNRSGSDFLEMPSPISNISALTYKAYSGSDEQNTVNFVAEFFPLNNITFSTNFTLSNNSYSGSAYGLQSDNSWSAGVDVSWTPNKCISLSVGYAHEENSTKEIADNNPAFFVAGTNVSVLGDSGPVLLTTDSYDTFTARADIVLIPEKLSLTTSGNFSWSTSDFHNPLFPDLDESIFHVDTWLKYNFNKCLAFKVGYIFEQFTMTNSYQSLYLTGTPSGNQNFNVLEGFYNNYTANVFEALVQYKF
ncbi:MAG: MtrB/PioB family outer membrane beta-barrel protein [Syntrophobacteraceae bacterium]